MDFDYAELQADVTEILTAAGFTAILEVPGTATGPAYDPTPGTPTTYNITVVDDQFSIGSIEDSLARKQVRTLYMAVGGVVPSEECRVQVDGVWHEIDKVRPVAPGNVDLLYAIELVG